MKRFTTVLFTSLLTFFIAGTISAQRIAVVDIQAVLESLPDYQNAQKELDRVAAEWRQEINQEYDKIKTLFNKFQAEQVLLSAEARKQREDEIMELEQHVRQMQRDRFGPEGLLFQRRQDMVRPLQDKVYGAIKDYAEDRGYDFILDKGGASGLIFSKPEYDKTSDVVRKVGGK